MSMAVRRASATSLVVILLCRLVGHVIFTLAKPTKFTPDNDLS